jgi:hypothetical protein
MNLAGGKVMLILFFDTKEIILHQWLPPRQTLSGQYYATVLGGRGSRNAIWKKRPDFSGKMVLPSRRRVNYLSTGKILPLPSTLALY